jgi:hypothetical protein
MIVLRPTPALARHMGVVPPLELLPVASPYADWCAHAFNAGRYRHLLLANTTSLLSLVFPARGVTHEAALGRCCVIALREYLGGTGRAFFFERFIAPESGRIVVAPVGDDAVLDAVCELVKQAKWFLAKSDLSLFETSDRLNQTPLAVLRGRSPSEAFAELPLAGLGRPAPGGSP